MDNIFYRHCPASEPLRLVIFPLPIFWFYFFLSLTAVLVRIFGVIRILVLRGVSPRPHLMEGIDSTTTMTTVMNTGPTKSDLLCGIGLLTFKVVEVKFFKFSDDTPLWCVLLCLFYLCFRLCRDGFTRRGHGSDSHKNFIVLLQFLAEIKLFLAKNLRLFNRLKRFRL